MTDGTRIGFLACLATFGPQPAAPFEYEPLLPEKPRRERDRSARRKLKARRQR